MKHYFQLVHFEINRFIKIYVALIAITVISQLTGLIIVSRSLVERMSNMSIKQLISVSHFGQISFHQMSSTLWFTVPLILFFAALLFYVFIIWYRDWFGKNSFIHRILMIPTARINIFLAKATAIILMVLGLASVQIILLIIEKKLLEWWLIPERFLAHMSLHDMLGEFTYLSLLIPQSFLNFIINYGIGFIVIIVLFTVVLLERSFKWLGIIIGIGYAALVIGLLYLPIRLLVVSSIIYLNELFIIISFSLFIVVAGSIWLSHFLLNKKISV